MPALAITLSLDHISDGDWDQLMEVDQDCDQPKRHDSKRPERPHDAYHDQGDMVAFISGLLLGSDQQVRAWFALFVRNGQKVGLSDLFPIGYLNLKVACSTFYDLSSPDAANVVPSRTKLYQSSGAVAHPTGSNLWGFVSLILVMKG